MIILAALSAVFTSFPLWMLVYWRTCSKPIGDLEAMLLIAGYKEKLK